VNSTSRYFAILQIAPSASSEEIRQAYVDLVRVWHPDRFVSDPRLQKVAEERMKEITEAYEALSSVPPPPEATVPAPPMPVGRRHHNPWLIAVGSAVVLLVFVVTLAQGMSMLRAPNRAAQFMKTEEVRIAGLLGPDPAVDAPIFHKPKPRANPKAIAPRPSNGSDLTPPRNAKGLGEFHVRNESALDCVLRVIDRNSPGTVLRSIYVHGGKETSIAGLKPGIYRMRVSFGQDWDGDALAFAQSDASEYWVGPFEFFETQSSSDHRGLRYNVGVRPPSL